jgi:hypothetical protein
MTESSDDSADAARLIAASILETASAAARTAAVSEAVATDAPGTTIYAPRLDDAVKSVRTAAVIPALALVCAAIAAEISAVADRARLTEAARLALAVFA